MKILILTFYYAPDLCAGSFRNTAFSSALSEKLATEDVLHIVTTTPNRYQAYIEDAPLHERKGNLIIDRVEVPLHKSGFLDQAISFMRFFLKAVQLVRKNKYDLVYASSSRLFTAFLGASIARWKGLPLYLDIRDLFIDTISEVIKNRIVAMGLKLALKPVESFSFRSAAHINMVSPGFEDYLKRFNPPSVSFHTNGIDDEFLIERERNKATPINGESVKTIIYAGNIGEGQGLEKIIPEAAAGLQGKFKFLVVGDGGTKPKLLEKVKAMQLDNVTLSPPVGRKQLMELYRKADYLFLHLNDYDAFNKVLPSKIFEYAALNKPIIAGVGGVAREFLNKEVGNVILFNPGDARGLIDRLNSTPYHIVSRDSFCQEYARKNIMYKMAESLLNTKR